MGVKGSEICRLRRQKGTDRRLPGVGAGEEDRGSEEIGGMVVVGGNQKRMSEKIKLPSMMGEEWPMTR